jgi:peptidoglycan/LPS O-acetylase OafA/YrhL
MTQHFHNVQALRGVACLLVVLVHLAVWDNLFVGGTPGFSAVQYFGFAGVDLFFVLSGFIITSTNRRSLGRPAAVPGYLFRRAWRIYPTYWAAMALSAAVSWALLGWNPLDAETLRQWPAWLTPAPGGNPVIGQAWTLTYELMFYLVFGALLLLPPRAAAAGLGAWAVVTAGALLAPAPTDPWAKLPVSPYVFEFLGGCAVAWFAGRGARGWERTACAVALAWATVGIVIVASGAEPYGLAMAGDRLRVLVFGPPAVLVVYAAVAAEGRWPRRVPRWLLRTGDASYSLYLVHYVAVIAAVVVGMKTPHTRLPHLAGLALTLAAMLALGFAFYALVERPLLNLARGRRKPAPAAAPPEERSTRRAA